MFVSTTDVFVKTQIRSLIARDLTLARNDSDLRQRLATNGYGFRDTKQGRILITLPHGVEILRLS